MRESNIVVSSNVYLSKTDNPRWDKNFISQVQDYSLLKEIKKYIQSDTRAAELTEKQEEILTTELRCVYAKKDPCWGYVNSAHKVLCACINGECPNIKKCNTYYSPEDEAYWTTSEKERLAYGEPDELKEYYLVDMISDEEMKRYTTIPPNFGRAYSTIANPIMEDEEERDQPKTRIDSKTGRKQYVIGQRWMLTDNSYEGEKLVDIWGFVDETDEKKQIERKRAKRIEVKENVSENIIDTKVLEPTLRQNDEFHEIQKQYETLIEKKILSRKRLIDLNSENLKTGFTKIIIDNPAEMAYYSSMLLTNKIAHGFDESFSVQLILIDELTENPNLSHAFVSNTVIGVGCKQSRLQAWKILLNIENLQELGASKIGFCQFPSEGKENRWCCRNLYGITHICISNNDIQNFHIELDGFFDVILEEKNGSYILKLINGNTVGNISNELQETLVAMKKADVIPGLPAYISGISILVKNGKFQILGMGHLHFVEY